LSFTVSSPSKGGASAVVFDLAKELWDAKQESDVDRYKLAQRAIWEYITNVDELPPVPEPFGVSMRF